MREENAPVLDDLFSVAFITSLFTFARENTPIPPEQNCSSGVRLGTEPNVYDKQRILSASYSAHLRVGLRGAGIGDYSPDWPITQNRQETRQFRVWY